MNVRQILDRPEREWDVKPPASEVEIALLESKARAELPTEYLELLRFSNGGEGPLALPPLWFQLYAFGNLTRPHRGRLIWPHLRHKNPFPPAC